MALWLKSMSTSLKLEAG